MWRRVHLLQIRGHVRATCCPHLQCGILRGQFPLKRRKFSALTQGVTSVVAVLSCLPLCLSLFSNCSFLSFLFYMFSIQLCLFLYFMIILHYKLLSFHMCTCNVFIPLSTDILHTFLYDMMYDMIWYDMIWYDMLYGMVYDTTWYDMIYVVWYMIRYNIYDIWYDAIQYDTIWYVLWYDLYDMIYVVWYMIWYIWYDMIYDMMRNDTIWYDMIWYMVWYFMIW